MPELVHAHLVEQVGAGRYRLHDLLRLYAAERVDAEDAQPQRREPVRRVLHWYLHSAAAAGEHLVPKRRTIALEPAADRVEPLRFAGYDDALAWCEQERANLVAATRDAYRLGELTIAWQLPAALAGFFTIRRYWADWIATRWTAISARLVVAHVRRQWGTARHSSTPGAGSLIG